MSVDVGPVARLIFAMGAAMDDQRHDDGRNDTSTEKLPGGGDGPPSRPRPRGVSVLFCHRGGVEAMRIEPDQPSMVIGRRAPADLCIPDPIISQPHARFTLVDGYVLVEDLDSTNGTWVNRERIDRPAILTPGGEAMLGNVSAHVVALGPVATPIVLGEAAFYRELDVELARAQCLNRSFAIFAVRPGETEIARARSGSWAMQLPANLRAVDRVHLCRPDTALILLPEASAEDAVRMASGVAYGAGQGGVRRVGLAVYKKAGSSAQKLVDRAREAAGRATLERPVVDASTSRRSEGDVDIFDAPIIGASQQELFSKAQRVASARVPVHIKGETGAGKEVLARFLHERGPRSGKPFVAVNCGAIPSNIVESELFGHEKGAFTGADQSKLGYFEAADKGTLFLDEVGELDPEVQKTLLRTLETRSIRRVGATQETKIDVRVISATHRDLKAMVEDGQFRGDLIFRLNTIELEMRPLRERSDEIEAFVERFLKRANNDNGRSVRGIAPEAMALLRAYSWPGNVRDLRNAIDHAVVLAEGDQIQLEDLPPRLLANALPAGAEGAPMAVLQPDLAEKQTTGGKLRSERDRTEAQLIKDALLKTGGNVMRAAERLGIPRGTLRHKIKVFGIKLPKR
ncbi:sigma 54-interacting transcriptional regulator [Sorangium sp. So ce1014]|uniref:sigma 54-interacting transcriptional regulator n=1 Tax=Sorangium sp. So ce1014 TaxID=3133326 RepID=UPI003F5F25E8